MFSLSHFIDKVISTGVNPSYCQHSILSMTHPDAVYVKEEYDTSVLDSNRLYDDVHIYCQPEPPFCRVTNDKMLKFHTYNNTTTSNRGYYAPNAVFPLYEDTNTL